MQSQTQVMLHPPLPSIIAYLQDEYEVVHGLAPLVDVVMGRAFVTVIKLDLLDHIRMAQDSQQHFV